MHDKHYLEPLSSAPAQESRADRLSSAGGLREQLYFDEEEEVLSPLTVKEKEETFNDHNRTRSSFISRDSIGKFRKSSIMMDHEVPNMWTLPYIGKYLLFFLKFPSYLHMF